MFQEVDLREEHHYSLGYSSHVVGFVTVNAHDVLRQQKMLGLEGEADAK